MKITYHLAPRETGKTRFSQLLFITQPENTLLVVRKLSIKDRYPSIIPKDNIISIFQLQKTIDSAKFNRIIFDECEPSYEYVEYIERRNPTTELIIVNTPPTVFPHDIFKYIKTILSKNLPLYINNEHLLSDYKYEDVLNVQKRICQSILVHPYTKVVDWTKERLINIRDNKSIYRYDIISKCSGEIRARLESQGEYLISDEKYFDYISHNKIIDIQNCPSLKYMS